MVDEEINSWTEFDLKDLHKLKEKTIKQIAYKLRKSQEDVTIKMIELGLYKKDPNVLMVPAKIVHKYDTTAKQTSSFVDEDRMKVLDHNLRVEQVQLQKDLLNEHREKMISVVLAINNNTASVLKMELAVEKQNTNLEKLIQYIEDATAGRLLKKSHSLGMLEREMKNKNTTEISLAPSQ